MVATFWLTVQTADFGGFFVAVGSHVRVVVVTFLLLLLFFGACTFAVAANFDAAINGRVLFKVHFTDSAATAHDAPTTEFGCFGGTTKGGAIGTFAAEDRGFVVLPIAATAPLEAAIFGPEKEPDACEDKAGEDEAEESKDAFVIYC